MTYVPWNELLGRFNATAAALESSQKWRDATSKHQAPWADAQQKVRTILKYAAVGAYLDIEDISEAVEQFLAFASGVEGWAVPQDKESEAGREIRFLLGACDLALATSTLARDVADHEERRRAAMVVRLGRLMDGFRKGFESASERSGKLALNAFIGAAGLLGGALLDIHFFAPKFPGPFSAIELAAVMVPALMLFYSAVMLFNICRAGLHQQYSCEQMSILVEGLKTTINTEEVEDMKLLRDIVRSLPRAVSSGLGVPEHPKPPMVIELVRRSAMLGGGGGS